jgi:hypothetical protein
MFLVCLPLRAQAKIVMVPRSCDDQVQVLKAALAVYPHPSSWTYYVVCDVDTWEKLVARYNGEARSRFVSVYGMTFLTAKVTILNGKQLVDYTSSDPKPDHIIAHELAHIYLNSGNEQVVDNLSLQWIRVRKIVDRPLLPALGETRIRAF